MNISKLFLVSAISAFMFLSVPQITSAQQGTADNDAIQQRLEEEGLDEAPDVVEVEDIEYSGQEPYSGFVDENGNPLTDEEYANWREENEKGFLRKNPWVLPVVLVVVAGAFVAMKRKK